MRQVLLRSCRGSQSPSKAQAVTILRLGCVKSPVRGSARLARNPFPPQIPASLIQRRFTFQICLSGSTTRQNPFSPKTGLRDGPGTPRVARFGGDTSLDQRFVPASPPHFDRVRREHVMPMFQTYPMAFDRSPAVFFKRPLFWVRLPL